MFLLNLKNMSAGDYIADRYMVEKLNAHPPGDHRPVFGRERELALLSESMRHSGPRVTHIHGISGIGKSALILAFATMWRSKRRTVLLLDGRTIEPTESGFQLELSRMLRIGRSTLGSIVSALSKKNKPVVIALDSYEVLGLLDAWLRQVFLSPVGKNVHMILVSRFAPAPQWTEAPALSRSSSPLRCFTGQHSSAAIISIGNRDGSAVGIKEHLGRVESQAVCGIGRAIDAIGLDLG